MNKNAIPYGQLVPLRAWWSAKGHYLNSIEHGECTWKDMVPNGVRLSLWNWWFGSYAWMTTALQKDEQSNRVKLRDQISDDPRAMSVLSFVSSANSGIDVAMLNVGHVACGIALELALKCAVIASNHALPSRTHGISEIYRQMSSGRVKDDVRAVSWHPHDHRHDCVDGRCIAPEDTSWNVAGSDDCVCECDEYPDKSECICEPEWVYLQIDTHYASVNRKYFEGASNDRRSSGYLQLIRHQAGNQLATDQDNRVIRFNVGGTELITIPKAARLNAEILNIVNKHVWNQDVIPLLSMTGLPRLMDPG